MDRSVPEIDVELKGHESILSRTARDEHIGYECVILVRKYVTHFTSISVCRRVACR